MMIAESISKHGCKNVTAEGRSNCVENVLKVIRVSGFARLMTRNLLTPHWRYHSADLVCRIERGNR
jgi:hypothetical protein